jgi:hypothetical protein
MRAHRATLAHHDSATAVARPPFQDGPWLLTPPSAVCAWALLLLQQQPLGPEL